MRRFLAATAALTLLAIIVTVSPALAWPWEVEGQPSMAEYAEGQADPPPDGVYLWVDQRDRVNVRVMGDQSYRLTFSLRYGEIDIIRTYGLDLNDHLEQDETKGMLFADIAGSNVPEGMRFSIGGNRMTVNCKTDGRDCPLDTIFLGDRGANPDELPFLVNRKD
jgi:hypothetical protein